MSFFQALLGDADSDPYAEVGNFLDDGHYGPLPTGSHTLNKNGTVLSYGPTLGFTKTTYPDRIEIAFDSPKPTSEAGCNVEAVIDRVRLLKARQTYADYHVGPIKGSKRIMAVDA